VFLDWLESLPEWMQIPVGIVCVFLWYALGLGLSMALGQVLGVI
jgi:hypothetical protein